MDILSVFRGLKKSNSETKLGDRLSFGRKSKSYGGPKSVASSPLPPRPRPGAGSCRIMENIAEVGGGGGGGGAQPSVSLHSPRRDTDQYGNACVPLVIQGNMHPSLPLVSGIRGNSFKPK